MRAFLDTNFLLDCVLPGRLEHAAAQTIKGLVDVGLIEGVVSACSLKDAYYILTKQTDEARARAVVRDRLTSYSVEKLVLPPPIPMSRTLRTAVSVRWPSVPAWTLSSRVTAPLLCARPSRPSRLQSSSVRFRFRRSKTAISGIVPGVWRACWEAPGPVTVTKNGYSKFVVLRSEDYDFMVQEQAKARLMARIAVAERERTAGMARDAFEALDDLEAKYGL